MPGSWMRQQVNFLRSELTLLQEVDQRHDVVNAFRAHARIVAERIGGSIALILHTPHAL